MPHIVRAPDSPSGDVFVLGAGFSRAAYRGMPLTDDLGRLVLDRMTDTDLRLGRPNFSAGGLTFESWLSWLGEEQPFDDPESALTRRALFVRLQNMIADALDEVELRALDEPPARWLYPLVQLFQLGVATVITFNYDRTVEFNLPERITDAAGEFIQRDDIVVPFYSQLGTMFGDGRPSPRDVAAFDYLKLHGSVDWWVLPDDVNGTSLEQGGRTAELTRAERNMRSTRRRFIVPPTAQKSGYYRSQITHFLWQQPAAALTTADRVAVLGYSLPLTDNAAASMLSGTVARTSARVDIVNPDADNVLANIAAVGCEPARLHTWDGMSCIADYVDHRSDEIARQFARRLTSLIRPSDNLAFAWSTAQRAQVDYVRLENDDRDLVLGTRAVSDQILFRRGTSVPGHESAPRALTGTDLPPGFDRVERVFLEAEQYRWPAVGTVSRAVVEGPDDDDWVTFYPIGRPPESSFRALRY